LDSSDLVRVVLIGIGATAIADLWSITRKQLFNVPLPNFGLVGRWFAHMSRGCFRHDSIATAPAFARERLIGWTAHYLIGIAFAAVLVSIQGVAWLREPTIGPALALGIATVVFPLLLMQPGMGAGIAASRAPRPAFVRIQSLLTHAVFGLGLFATARLFNILYPT
jgi:DUF2938 family protein